MVRAHQRRLVAERQRMLRKAAAGAVGLTAVAGAGQAQAATFTVTNLNDAGAGSLRDAVGAANAAAGTDTVDFQPGLTGTITLAQTIAISDSVAITGPGADVLTIDGNTSVQMFAVAGATHLSGSFSGLTMSGGLGPKYGGAIRAKDADVTVTGSTFTGNTALKYGGAIGSVEGQVTISGSTFVGNGTKYAGGAVALRGGGLDVTDSEFTTNSTQGKDVSANTSPPVGGGAIHTVQTTAPVTITGTTISGNTSFTDGGGLSVEDGAAAVTITDSELSDNTATDEGGGAHIDATNAAVTISGTTVSGNTSTEEGGGVNIYGTVEAVTISDSTLSGNTSTDEGGGAYIYEGDGAVTVDRTVVSGNTSKDENGGGLFIGETKAPTTVRDSQITGNTAGDSGGGLASYDAEGDVLVEGTLVSGNTSNGVENDNNGGGIWFEDTLRDDADQTHTTTLRNSTVVGNTAGRFGGGVAFSEQFYGEASIVQSTITGNTAEWGGGLQLGQTYAGFRLTNSTLSGNQALSAGGGVYRATDDGSPYAAEGDIVVSGSVISGNTAPADADFGSYAGTTGEVTFGNSLIENPTEPFTTNPLGTVQTDIDPKLGALAANGGPLPTMLPAVDSPLLDAGVANGLISDQRGLARTKDFPGAAGIGSDTTDIGAVERQANGAPVVTPGSGVTVTEDTAQAVTGASVADADDAGAAGTVTFTVSPAGAGTLALNLPGATGNGTGSVSATATLADINAAIAAGKLVFTPAQDRDTDASITMTYEDAGVAEDATKLSDSGSIPLDITPVNDAPVVHAGTGTTVVEDTAKAIDGISISDVDEDGNGTATFSVAAGVGTLHLDLPGATGNDSTSVSVTASLADINAALAAGKLVLTPAANRDADATVNVAYKDTDDASDDADAALKFTPVNDQPVVTAPAAVDVTEDTPATINGVSISDVDDEGMGTFTVKVDPAAGGTLALDLPSVTGNGTDTVTVSATLADVNAALAAGKLVFTPAADRDTDATLDVSWRDAGSKSDTTQLTGEASTALKLVPVNDAPTVAPGPEVPITEDTPTPVTFPVISDVDAEGVGTVAISAPDGTLALDLPGATGNGTGTVGASATMADVNAAIAAGKLVFTPKANLDQNTTLTITFTDNGSKTDTTKKSGAGTTNLVVKAVNDAPTLTVPGAVTLDAGTSVTLAPITVADVDATRLEVRLAVGEGRLKLPVTTGLTFTEGGPEAGAIRFSGTVAEVQAALAGVVFTAAPSGTTSLPLEISVNDLGGTGDGGVKAVQGFVGLTIRPTPVAPPPPVVAASVPPLCNGISITMQATLNGSRVEFVGVALQRLAGQSVQITDGKRVVTSTVIAADGTFKASVAATPAARRGTVRYQAVTAEVHSASFKPIRRIVLRRNGGTVTGRVKVDPGFRAASAKLYRDVSCGTRALIGTVKLSPQGTFKLQVETPASGFAVYRIRVQVGKRLVSYSQPILVLR